MMSNDLINDSALPTMNIYLLIASEFQGSEYLDLSFVWYRKEELVLNYYGCLDSELL